MKVNQYITDSTLAECQEYLGRSLRLCGLTHYERKPIHVSAVMPLKDVAQAMGMSMEGVRRIEKSALKKLRESNGEAFRKFREFAINEAQP